MAERAIKELGGERHLVVRGPVPKGADPPGRPRRPRPGRPPRYAVGDSVATRKAYGDALVALGAADPRVLCWTLK